MSTFKVGDRVTTKFGSGTVIHYRQQSYLKFCVEHDVERVHLHDGNPHINGGCKGRRDRCWWFDYQELATIMRKTQFKGNK